MMESSYNAKDEDGHIQVSGPGGGTLRSKKPENTAFKQQRLPAWQPILTAGTVLPAFFIIGLIFIPIGIGLYVTSNNIKEFEVTLRYQSWNKCVLSHQTTTAATLCHNTLSGAGFYDQTTDAKFLSEIVRFSRFTLHLRYWHSFRFCFM